MARPGYDPVKAHDYYERTKKLKGRKKGTSAATSGASNKSVKSPGKLAAQQKAKARVGRLRGKIARLKTALSETEALISQKRQEARKTAKKNSDGKTTAKERQDSKQYRDKHKQELASKRKAKDTKSGGSSGSSSSGSAPKSPQDMSLAELEDRSIKIRVTIQEAQRQLSNANQQLGQLAHSMILSSPDVNELFAHFQSAEGIPSK